jgi:hypothetical protein
MAELIALVESGALRTMESGSVGIGTLIYVLATR